MPFDREALRLERFQAEVSYHSAYTFWNLRGVLAERWAHGPVFGGTTDAPQQTTLLPVEGGSLDQRLQAAYGLSASGVVGEGRERTGDAEEIASEFIPEALEVLKPKRVVRVAVNLFGLYPVSDVVQASRRVRGTFYRSDAIERVLPESARRERDRFHAAIDFIVPEDDRGMGLSVVVGAVGPPHRGTFFAVPDADRDNQWWMGFRLERRRVDEDGINDPSEALSSILRMASDDYAHVTSTVLTDILT